MSTSKSPQTATTTAEANDIQVEGEAGGTPTIPLLATKSLAARYHDKIPVLRKLPAPVVGIILAIGFLNIVVWAVCGVVLHFHGHLMGTAILVYTLGLRHALDADHISAIDLMTRRLIASGGCPVTVGMFFSLGHSTIVVITSIAVAATAASFSERFDSFSKVGGIVGTSVSATFLIVLGILNAYILFRLIQQLQKQRDEGEAEGGTDIGGGMKFQGQGCLIKVFSGAFRMVDRPWKMYPLGVLFGLGFDTSSEVALLGISSLQGSAGTSIWLILIFPILFTVGMCLLDTTDGALMSALYTTSSFAHDNIAILYYSIVLTLITIMVAIVIGVIQLLTLVLNVAEPTGRFWDGVEKVGDSYDIVGAAIIGLFAVSAVGSMLAYKPWRRRFDAERARRRQVLEEERRRTLEEEEEETVLEETRETVEDV